MQSTLLIWYFSYGFMASAIIVSLVGMGGIVIESVRRSGEDFT